jgi:hypothetical protein
MPLPAPTTHNEKGTDQLPSAPGFGSINTVMQMPSTIMGVFRWFAREHGFLQLPPEAQRAAWALAALTHAVILVITLGLIAVMPKVSVSLHSVTLLHFLLGLLAAKSVEIISAARKILKRPPLWLISSGWFFAFSFTLVPLLVVAFVSWLLD